MQNRVFNSWEVIEDKGRVWVCRCKCGLVKPVNKFDVVRGKSKQCKKCSHAAKIGVPNTAIITHGLADSPTMRSWSEMKRRCYAKHRKEYPNYGGRGIKVCDRWLDSFANFVADMGVRPGGTTLHRVDNDGDYSPENCKWVDRITQESNKRSSRFVTVFGKTICLSEACRKYGKNYYTTHGRLRRGLSIEKALDII